MKIFNFFWPSKEEHLVFFLLCCPVLQILAIFWLFSPGRHREQRAGGGREREKILATILRTRLGSNSREIIDHGLGVSRAQKRDSSNKVLRVEFRALGEKFFHSQNNLKDAEEHRLRMLRNRVW